MNGEEMKKLLFLSAFLLIASPLFAAEPSLSEVLAWKYGFVASTCQENPSNTSQNPKMVICGWKSADPIPSESQIAQDTIDYKAFVIADKAAKEAERDAVLVKLKISKEEFEKLNAKI